MPGHYVLLKDEFVRDLEYDKKQETVVTSIFTWLRQLSNRRRLILAGQLTLSETVTER